MRMSCNGCRVLRKGCSEDCIIRPCLQWIKNPESQGNATVFLAKFYGRAGLLNLIGAGPDHLRPAIFRSLLYEACGRIVNPIYGSVGLLWSGHWQLCQAAVEAVLKGAPVIQIPSDKAAEIRMPQLKSFDIRHVAKNGDVHSDLHKVAKTSRTAFKRSTASSGSSNGNVKIEEQLQAHETSGQTSSSSMVSAETVEESMPELTKNEVELELTLGLGLGYSSTKQSSSASTMLVKRCAAGQQDESSRAVDLALDLTA